MRKRLFIFILLALCAVLPPAFSLRALAAGPGSAPAPEFSVSLAGHRLTWESVPSAEKYVVRRRVGGEVTVLGETKARYFTDKNAPSGVGVSYAVTAVDEKGAEGPLRWYNTLHLARPTVTAEEVMAGYGLSWDDVGAKKYLVYRRSASGGPEELIARTEKTSFTDSRADPDGSYIYSVRGLWGSVSSVCGVCCARPSQGIPDFPGFAPEGFEISVAGKSGLGRDIYLYSYGSGENTLFLTFAIHGWEDAFDSDGRAHTFTAFRVMERISDLAPEDWRVLVIPCANPDGVIDGRSHNGPGRCTLMMYGEDGALVPGGVDMNRCFPAYWERHIFDRNFNGYAPLACPEAELIAGLMESSLGSGENVFIDVHGWTEQILTPYGWNSLFYHFAWDFPTCEWMGIAYADGYAATYASTLGYDACLFEFPYRHSSLSSFISSSLPDRFAGSVAELVE